MSAQADSCPSCGSALPERSRFCPHCGAQLATASETSVAGTEEPTIETVANEAAAPNRRAVGVTRGTLLFGLGLAALAVGLVLLVGERWLAGAVCGVIALAVFAALAMTARRTRSASEQGSPLGRGAVRARAGSTLRSVSARSEARRRLVRHRYDLVALDEERGRRLRSLGEAVYEGDTAAADRLSIELSELDRRIGETSAEIASIAATGSVRPPPEELESGPEQESEPEPPPERVKRKKRPKAQTARKK